MSRFTIKIVMCTTLALIAFAGNSVLCRLALGEQTIDAASFTIIRLISGVLVLFPMVKFFSFGVNQAVSKNGSWFASVMLFLYAMAFSYAYVSLETGTGALILFGAVQMTMICSSFISGNRLHFSEWCGVVVAFLGVVYLVYPNLATPSLAGFIFMLIAGIAWGLYTLAGKNSQNPLGDTTFNFIRTLPFVLLLAVVAWPDSRPTDIGVMLAIMSGVLASGLGYTIWYIALEGLSATQAAVVQLLVPVIATAGGVVFAQEVVSLRLMISSALILGGILSVVLGRYYFVQKLAVKHTSA